MQGGRLERDDTNIERVAEHDVEPHEANEALGRAGAGRDESAGRPSA
jgi:hypothetical protein